MGVMVGLWSEEWHDFMFLKHLSGCCVEKGSKGRNLGKRWWLLRPGWQHWRYEKWSDAAYILQVQPPVIKERRESRVTPRFLVWTTGRKELSLTEIREAVGGAVFERKISSWVLGMSNLRYLFGIDSTAAGLVCLVYSIFKWRYLLDGRIYESGVCEKDGVEIKIWKSLAFWWYKEIDQGHWRVWEKRRNQQRRQRRRN